MPDQGHWPDAAEDAKEALKLVAELKERVYMLEASCISDRREFEGLMKQLYGNGQRGTIKEIQEEQDKIKRLVWIGVGVGAVLQILLVAGILSIKPLFGTH